MDSIGICSTVFVGNTQSFTNQRNRILIINQESLEITPAAWTYRRLICRSRAQCRTHSMISSKEVLNLHNYLRIKESPTQLEEQICHWVNNMPFSRRKLMKKLLSSISNKNSKYNNNNNISLHKSNRHHICHKYCNNINNNSNTITNKQ